MSQVAARPAIVYPEDDGNPMSENTVQFRWITTLQGGLDALFRDRPDVFVAGDNLIYAREGDPKVRTAPDVYVAFGRPKGGRGSYKVWEEGGVFPQVVFEVLSPGNRGSEMARKFKFYDQYGAEEYYIYDPDTNDLSGWWRADGELEEIPSMDQYVSPRLGVRFDLTGPEMVVFNPDGSRFLTYLELTARAEQAAIERRRAEAAEQRAERMADLLRAAGIDPDALP